MADDITLPGTGSVVAADEVSSKFYQRVKPAWGADGTANDAQVSAPLPVQVTIDSNQMSTAGTIVTPKFASISVSSSGDNQIVAANATKKLRVLAYTIVADGTVAAKWRNGTTDVTGAMSWVANTGISAPFCPVGHFETSTNAALNLNLSAAVGARGHVTYIEV